jgi:hypothetical protein
MTSSRRPAAAVLGAFAGSPVSAGCQAGGESLFSGVTAGKFCGILGA